MTLAKIFSDEITIIHISQGKRQNASYEISYEDIAASIVVIQGKVMLLGNLTNSFHKLPLSH